MAMNVVNVNINKKQTSSNRISDIRTTDRNSQPQSVNVSSTGEEVVETEELDLSIEDEVEESNNAEIQEEVEETEGWSIGGMLSGAWDSVTGFVEEVGETATEILTDVGNAVADTGATLVGGIETLWEATTDVFTGAMETIASWGSALFEWGANRLTDIKEFAVGAGDVLIKSTEKINEILKATGATVATIGLGLVEGILEFGEAIVDAAVIILGAVATIVTGIVDIGSYLITGEDLGLTSGMWDGIMGFVSEQWVSGAFDMLYEDTGAGRWIAENAVGFETVRSVSAGIGYVTGMIVLTVATCGAGTAPTVAGTISSTAAQGAVIAGVAGFGQGAEESWGNGATLKEGLGYAGVRGIYEGVSYYLGGKMSGVVLGEGVSAVSRISTSALRIGFDALDGGLSGVIDPAAKMIYNDKSYSESFEENGGWQAVATNAAIGAGMSSFGEITDNIKFKKINKNITSEISSDKSFVSSSKMSSSNYRNIDVKSNVFTKFIKYLKGRRKFGNSRKVCSFLNSSTVIHEFNPRVELAAHITYIDGIKFASETATGLKELTEFYIDLKNTYKYDSVASKKLFELSHKELVVTDINIGNSTHPYDDAYQKSSYVFLGKKITDTRDYSIFFHETGHFSDWLSSNYNVGIKNISKIRKDYGTIRVADVERVYNDGIQLRKEIDKYLKDPMLGQYEVRQIADKKYFEIEGIDNFSQEDKQRIYNKIYYDIYQEKMEYYYNESGLPAIEDIMDAMTDGKFQSKYKGVYGHGEKYYSRPNIFATEIIANYSDLYFRNKTNLLEVYFSKEFADSLEKVHNSIAGIDKLKFDYSNKDNISLLNSIQMAQETKKDKVLFEVLEEWVKYGNSTVIMNERLKSIGIEPQIVFRIDHFQIYGLLEDYQQSINQFLEEGKIIMNNKYPNANYYSLIEKYIKTKDATLFTRDNNFRFHLERLTDQQLLKYVNTMGGNNG